MFRFSDGTNPSYKVFIKVPLNVNAGDISGLNPADQSTYTTGYPPVFSDPAKAPWVPDISPASR